MSALGIIGLILAAIVLLITALLCIPAGLLITYDAQNGFQMRAHVLWFSLNGKKPLPEAKEESASDQKKKEEKPKQQGGVDLRTLKDHAEEIVSLLGQTLRRIGFLSRRIRVKELALTCIAGGDDPAAAADQYGKTCAVLYPALAALHGCLRVNEENERVTVACDFGGESRFDLRLLLQLRAVHALRAVAPLILPSLSLLRWLRPGGGAASRKPPSKA